MNKTSQIKYNISLFVVISICFAIGMVVSSFVFFFYYTFIIVTVLIMCVLNKSNKAFIDTLTIFLSTLLFGFFLAVMVNCDYVHNEVTFLYPDQIDFFENAKFLASQNSVSELLDKATMSWSEYNVAYGLFGLLGYFDKLVSGTVNFLPLLISVVYLTALIPVYLYHILKIYVSETMALRGSLFYGLLTPIMSYSGYLLRDIHLALIFIIILFWIVRKVTFTRILGIIILLPIVANLRLANSLLVLAMLGIYVFFGKTYRFTRIFFTILSMVFIINVGDQLSDTVKITQSRIDGYEEFTRAYAEESKGIGKQIYNFPPVIQKAATIFIGLTNFPFWGKPPVSISFSQFMMILYSTITNIGWFFVIVGVFYFIKPIYVVLIKMSSKILFCLVILFALYILTNVSNMDLRRIMYVFPFVYIPFIIVYNDLSIIQKKKYKHFTIAFGLFLSFTYVILLLL
ncbi:MAG: hypothetical protein PHY55_01090 [Bacteroidales bacterium]|nr:hypothetical protein [Bacteroidales bacterium]